MMEGQEITITIRKSSATPALYGAVYLDNVFVANAEAQTIADALDAIKNRIAESRVGLANDWSTRAR